MSHWRAVLGGLVAGTILTLLAVPTLYTLLRAVIDPIFRPRHPGPNPRFPTVPACPSLPLWRLTEMLTSRPFLAVTALASLLLAGSGCTYMTQSPRDLRQQRRKGVDSSRSQR